MRAVLPACRDLRGSESTPAPGAETPNPQPNLQPPPPLPAPARPPAEVKRTPQIPASPLHSPGRYVRHTTGGPVRLRDSGAGSLLAFGAFASFATHDVPAGITPKLPGAPAHPGLNCPALPLA